MPWISFKSDLCLLEQMAAIIICDSVLCWKWKERVNLFIAESGCQQKMARWVWEYISSVWLQFIEANTVHSYHDSHMCCYGILSFSTHCLCYYRLYYKAPYFFCIPSCHSFYSSLIWLRSTYLARRFCTLSFWLLFSLLDSFSHLSPSSKTAFGYTHTNKQMVTGMKVQF